MSLLHQKNLQRDSSVVHSSVCSPSGVLYGKSISAQIYLGEKHRTYLYESRFFAENGTENQFRHILTTEVHITFAVTVSFTASNDIDTKVYSDSVNTQKINLKVFCTVLCRLEVSLLFYIRLSSVGQPSVLAVPEVTVRSVAPIFAVSALAEFRVKRTVNSSEEAGGS